MFLVILGFDMWHGNIIQKHTAPIAHRMFSMQADGDHPKILLVLDGTNIYVKISNNVLFQRRTNSMQKERLLVHHMTIITISGCLVSIIGLYLAEAKNSDDQMISNHILKHNSKEIMSFITKKDALKDRVIHAEITAFMTKGQRLIPTRNTNSSRLT